MDHTVNDLDLGCLVTGTVEVDPQTANYAVRIETDDGPVLFDVQAFLGKYLGQEIRLTVASTEMIAKMQAIVDEQELPRTPSGTINNCALACGYPEAECQMCPNKCPDRARFGPNKSLS